jgi:hypothetical protein
MSGAPVADKRPPDGLVRTLNRGLRPLLKSRLGRAVPGPLVVLGFAGRRSGRGYEIVVGWHDAGDTRAVFTPAQWRLNFRGGAPVSVVRKGRRLTGTGTLVEDPDEVARGLQHALDSGSTAKQLGIHVDAGHRITPDDVRAARRAMIRLELGA